jgi:hypothetical protein
MSFIVVMGWIGVVVGTVVLLYGLNTALAEVSWRARWRWGQARKIKRSVKLGWNTGEPPEGQLILVRDHTTDLCRSPRDIINNGWSVMVRQGDWCTSLSGGFQMPVKNLTGWLEITDG